MTETDTIRPASATFPNDPAGLAPSRPSTVVDISDGGMFELRIAPVDHRVGERDVRMLAYNGSIPGPTLRVRRGSTITVHVRNEADLETTVHWHGLRLDNRDDGVAPDTQDPIPVGGEYTYHLRFPDDGLYWYHPHVREDYALEMGLYGNIIVDPPAQDAWPAVHREAVLTLDDVLLKDGQVAPFRVAGPTHTAMGRFGNVMLVAGTTDPVVAARAGEVVRFFLTNTANTRLFNVAVPGARMKLIAGDNGRVEREEWIDGVLLGPSERAVVDVRFPAPGPFPIEHRTPDRTYRLGTVEVSVATAGPEGGADHETLHEHAALVDERRRLDQELRRPPDKTLIFDASMALMHESHDVTSATTCWTCVMHPEIVATQPGTCPKCGMQLVPADPAVCDGAAAAGHEEPHHDHHGADGLEWEDLMPEMNAATDATNMVWKLVDGDTGLVNGDIDWAFRVGDRVKIRLVNTMDSDHPMHHPFHVHGAGRFLVVARDGVPEPNLGWKDTVLVRAGETVDIVLDVTGRGRWMAHCHIAEHNQDGMMFRFLVEPA